MKTAIPLAVEDRTTEPASDSAHTIATAAASSIAGSSTRSGHQPPATQMITAASRNTVTTYAAQTTEAAAQRASSSARRDTGRTSSGCSSPRSASPRTAPSVRNTARTVPRNSVANMFRPSSVAPAMTSASTPSKLLMSAALNTCQVPSP